MCCPLKISSDYTHSNKSVFSFFFYDWLLTSWTLQKQLVLFPAKQCQELFSKTSGAPKKSISIQKESSLVQNSINYPFDLTLDLKHDSSLKTKRRKMHVKWLLLLTFSHRCTNGGLSSSCYNFSEEIDWDIPLHHFMIPKCALYIQEQVLRESERQLVVVYAYMQILPLPPFKSLNRIYSHFFVVIAHILRLSQKLPT